VSRDRALIAIAVVGSVAALIQLNVSAYRSEVRRECRNWVWLNFDVPPGTVNYSRVVPGLGCVAILPDGTMRVKP
jgi:hypothetical protein